MQFLINFDSGKKVVYNKYCILHKIGSGTYSSIYSIGLQKRSRQSIRAIKIQHEKVPHPQISTQVSVLKNIQGCPDADVGFVKLFEYGFQAEYNYAVMQLLGPSLQQLLKVSGGRLALKTVLILGLQMIDRIQVLHNAGFIYRDIKPENFVMGTQNKSHIVHLIDFGKCKRYKNKQTGKHVPYRQDVRFQGQSAFSSINTHNGSEYSRRDDVEAILYLLIYLRKGKLPWISSKQFKSKKQRETAIQEAKKKLPIQHLTYKMPIVFTDLLYYVRTLDYYEKPEYDYVRTLLHSSFPPDEDNMSMVFDWNKMNQFDLALYVGQPKITLRTQMQKDQSQLESIKQAEEYQHIRQSNSIDVNVLMNKMMINDINQEPISKQSSVRKQRQRRKQ